MLLPPSTVLPVLFGAALITASNNNNNNKQPLTTTAPSETQPNINIVIPATATTAPIPHFPQGLVHILHKKDTTDKSDTQSHPSRINTNNDDLHDHEKRKAGAARCTNRYPCRCGDGDANRIRKVDAERAKNRCPKCVCPKSGGERLSMGGGWGMGVVVAAAGVVAAVQMEVL